MNTDRDKYLTEAMGFREGATVGDKTYWFECGIDRGGFETINFSTWQEFGKLWEWAQEQEWINLFMCDTYYSNYDTPHEAAMDNDGYLHADYINPDRFASAVYEFLKGRES